MFGGTGEGKGGTSYNVQFDQAGNPIVYANKVASQSAGTLGFGLKLALAVAGLNGLEGLLGSTTGAAGTSGLSALDAGMNAYGTTGNIGAGSLLGGAGAMTEAELAQANMALGGAGGSAGAAELEAALASGTPTITNTALTGGSGILTGAAGGITADSVAAKLAADSVIPSAISNAATAAKSPLSVSDAIRLAGIGASLYGANKLANSLGSSGSGGSGGYDIVPIPSDWTSPIKPTATAEFTPLAPIDFGNKEMLRGTQWEQLLSPDYGKAPAMPTVPTNPSNMSFNELTKILGGSRESIPTSNLIASCASAVG
jgi:hypothetical protein